MRVYMKCRLSFLFLHTCTHHCTSFSFQDLSFVKEVDAWSIEFRMKGQMLILVSCGGIKMRVYIFMSTLSFIPPHFYSSLYEFCISGPELYSGGRWIADRILDEMAATDSLKLWRNKYLSLHSHVGSHFYFPILLRLPVQVFYFRTWALARR